MPRLDLHSSRAKVTRAFEHLAVLEQEIPALIDDESPYELRFGRVDQQTGWCDVVLASRQAAGPHLGVVFGDVVHNLRCALDYIVTALADASRVRLTHRHQFPIFASAERYEQKVGTIHSAIATGPLGGIAVGLVLAEQVQPYRLEPEPRADPLWHVHRFSNADKHREVAGFLAIPGGSVKIGYAGVVAEKLEIPEIAN